MLFSVFASLTFGVIIEFVGAIVAAAIANGCAVGVNLLSMTDCLSIQKVTFVLFVLSRSSSFSLLFSYTLGIMIYSMGLFIGGEEMISQLFVVDELNCEGGEFLYWDIKEVGS